jgi:general secretion pathway protein E
MSNLNIAERRLPQDGRIQRMINGRQVDLRVSTLPTAFGESVVLRVLDRSSVNLELETLGMPPDIMAYILEVIEKPNGIFIVTGPTGSGKTTTLYSTLKQLATPEVNVCTVEDPIEMIEPAFNQMQVQHNIGLNFADGIHTLLRQDPDIIMVGEIRDLETGEMAIQAALTGHLVLSTLHTNDAPSAVTRLLELGVPAYLINSTLIGVMAQRLARTLCPHCKTDSEISDALWTELTSPWKLPKPASIHIAAGCLECRMTGYRGRTGIYEMLPVSKELQKLVVGDCELAKLRAQAHSEGMKPLRVNGAEKIAAGLTTPEEILRITPPPLD